MVSKPKNRQKSVPKGIYFWGSWPRKNLFVDTFYTALPTHRKMRVHFHRFMYRVHDELNCLGEVNDPLELVADKFSNETDIICFDEFCFRYNGCDDFRNTLSGTIQRGVILVATSNIPPNELYRNGLQRGRFLPAIDLILQNCDVINVDSGIDYRLRTLEQAEIFHYPLDEVARTNLKRYYGQLVGEGKSSDNVIEVNHRQLAVIETCDDVLHATFAQLCQTTRSQMIILNYRDYITQFCLLMFRLWGKRSTMLRVDLSLLWMNSMRGM